MSAPPSSAEALPEDVVAFIQGGVSITMASRNASLQTTLSRGLACHVSPDRMRVTVVLHPAQAAAVLADVRSNGLIAVVFSQPSTHKTIQLKGCDARIEPLRPFHHACVDKHTDDFVADLMPFGEFSKELLRAMLSSELDERVAVGFTPTTRFAQTPGPGAGRRLP